MTSDERAQPTIPRSRRSLLAAAAAAGGALATQALVRPAPVAAADVVLGAVNTAVAATTIRNTQALNSAKAIVGLVTYAGAGPSTAGVQGQSYAVNGNGVFGVAMTGNSKGVWGRSADGTGVFGEATGTTGTAFRYGVHGVSRSFYGIGVRGDGPNTGVWGVGGTWGVYGSGTRYGVQGTGNTAGLYGSGGTYGVYGFSSTHGLFGDGGNSGVVGSGGTYGVRGYATGGVSGAYGVYGEGHDGVVGTGTHDGVVGTGTHDGVVGRGNNVGVRGVSSNIAGYFAGNTHVQGTFTGTDKQFLIDHPQDPANKVLAHSCVEAPEMLNVYSGSVTLDAKGRATVRMPRYFRALNREYRYQLTAIGAPAPNLHVSREITAGSFAISGGTSGQKVCWIVTGVRQDAWAQKHPLRVERSKKRKDRGKYLNPEVFGKPRSDSMHPIPKVPRRPRRLPRPKAA